MPTKPSPAWRLHKLLQIDAMNLVILIGLKFTLGLRVSEEDEEEGLDHSQHGEQAYRS